MDRAWPAEPDGGWPDDPATRYALDVRDGRIIAGPHVRNACARHGWDLVQGGERGLSWDMDAVDWTLDFFRSVLRLNGGQFEDVPFEPLPWEAFILGSLFGWKLADGTRRYRVAFVETAKGSGKSPLAAGIGIMMFVADGEARAEVYSAATKKDQAMILFRDAVAMVEQSPQLSSRIRKLGVAPVYNLTHEESGSFFRPIASDDSQSGPRPHCSLIDEIHEHKNRTVVEMMRAGVKFRRQPLQFMITNSGFDRTSVCYEMHEYGERVAGGQFEDDSFFPYVCAIDEGDDPLTDADDPELGYPRSWAKANPSIGHTFKVSYLRDQVREARGMPSKESSVRRLHFCEWVDAENPWISGDAWRACQVPEIPADVRAGPCYAALDLSGKRDLTALACVWLVGETMAGAVSFWTPGDTLLHRASVDRVPYDVWEREGHVNAPEGKSIDYAYVAHQVADLYRAGSLAALAFDPYRMDDFARELDTLGVPWWIYDGPDSEGDGLMLVRHGQGFGGGNSETSLWMPRSITVLEDAILAGTAAIEDNPCLTWNAASAVLAQDPQENRKWEKRKSTGRIDGVVALSMAAGLAVHFADHEAGESIYETQGIRTL